MQVKKLRDRFVVRLEPGEEVIASLAQFADDIGVGFAEVSAIGTFNRVTLGYFDATTNAYRNQVVEEQVEVLNLLGSISRGEKGEPIVHLHVTIGRADYTTLGGHLVDAIVSPTLEVVIDVAANKVRRQRDPATGLMVWDLW